MPDIEWIVLYMALGAIAGFIAGLLGFGGGGMLVPLLASIFTMQGMSTDNVVHLALGTSLACMIISSTASIRAHAFRGTVMWRAAGGMAPGIVIGAFLSAHAATNLNSTFIAVFFALFMALIALQMFVNWQPEPSKQPITLRGLLAAGVGIGSVSALTAVGGGFLTVAYLSYKSLDIKTAIGTSAAIGFPLAIAGTASYMISGWSITLSNPYTLGFIYMPAFLAVSIAGAIAAHYSARCSHRLPEAFLKKALAIISLLLSIKMLASIA
ncbi:MAG: hypothetical protein A4S08_02670 [Proteobacteria bacterium SG_bin4]|nr:MAG: hypothetical protein A4S08_02670 [Proteobacteria bacterium SG_bin4]